ncbi:MAG: hypothetical protein ACYCVH_07925 [Ignavibacteriaceae bacterium]
MKKTTMNNEAKHLFFRLILSLSFAFLFLSASVLSQTNPINSKQPWKGYAILGNGNICVVYSDDPRISKLTGAEGIQHFYFNNYTADYISSSSFKIQNDEGNHTGIFVGMKNFFTTETRTNYSNGLIEKVDCFVHPKDAVVLTVETKGSKNPVKNIFNLVLRKTLITDRIIKLTSLKIENNFAVAAWSNGTIIAVTSKSPNQKIEVGDSTISILSQTNDDKKTEIIITAARSREEIEPGNPSPQEKLISLLHSKDLQNEASRYWNKWMEDGKLPKFKSEFAEGKKYLEYFKRTLYAVKSACLNGQIPADITGEFVTGNMPQLYPRDAMMCARVFLMTGHFEEAKKIILFWAGKNIPEKSDGEFYARYDAYAKAVDAGSGARYDEPEWDANGYFIQLVNDYHHQKNIWLADKSFIYKLADFLVRKIDKSGLLYEGGIVEWTGYLPSTNMTCAAALKTASEIASKFGNAKKSKEYLNASETISKSLSKLFDARRKTFTDLRFHGVKAAGNLSISNPTADTLYLWDTSVNFGVLWGYPNNTEISQTNNFIENSATKQNGGVEYFEAKDNSWLSGYGGDVFFFTTAAAAQYQSLFGKNSLAKEHIDWMIKNSNVYGLMPERIYLNETDCSDASPLSWCNAEFAASVFIFSKKLNNN